jgi:hypothetical protein
VESHFALSSNQVEFPILYERRFEQIKSGFEKRQKRPYSQTDLSQQKSPEEENGLQLEVASYFGKS